MLAGCLHWPGEVAPPPGCVSARGQRPRGSQAGGMLARTWQGGSQGWGSEDMALRTELGSPRWTDVWCPRVSQSPLRTSLAANTDHEWVTGRVPIQWMAVDTPSKGGGFWVGLCDLRPKLKGSRACGIAMTFFFFFKLR